MIKISKNRLEAFSDGVIAIIITIMILNIPLPDQFGFNDIMRLCASLLVFFVSFFIVASQWNKHRFLFDGVEDLSNKMIWRNLLYLFFLSLIPIFTKWVMQNPDEVAPVIGYDIVFILVNICYQFLWHTFVNENNSSDIKAGDKLRAEHKYFWVPIVVMFIAIAAIISLAFYYPRISLIFSIGFPVVTSLFNLIFEDNRNYRNRLGAGRRIKGG